MKVYKAYLLTVFLIFSGVQFNSIAQQNKSELNVLSEGADIIIIGKVSDQNSRWNEDKTRIYTDVNINVDEYLKGNTNRSSIIVTHLGGEVDEVGELYSHIPSFNNEEDVLLFVKKSKDDNTYNVFQGEYGKISLIKDESSGELMTSNKTKLSSLKGEINNHLEVK